MRMDYIMVYQLICKVICFEIMCSVVAISLGALWSIIDYGFLRYYYGSWCK